jgi:hypothetical protein
MKRPENYQELQAAAVVELKLKQYELEERAGDIKCLISRFYDIVDWDHPEKLPEFNTVDDWDDLPDGHVQTMISNGRAVQTLPGQGYW